MDKNYTKINNLKISNKLLKFVNEDLLNGTDVKTEKFWSDFDRIVHELAPKNRELLKKEMNYKIKSIIGT